MPSLKEAIAAASSSTDSGILAELKALPPIEGYGAVDCGRIVAYLASVGKYNDLKSAALTNSVASAAIDTLLYRSNMDFSIDGMTGMLDYLESQSHIDATDKSVMLGMASYSQEQFPDLTLYDIKRERDTLDYVEKQQSGGFVSITVSADCEPHRPQIFAEVGGAYVRVAGFVLVDKAGVYAVQVPRINPLYVADAYGVIR